MANILDNPSFETNTTGWANTSTGTTFVRSTAQSNFGTASGLHSRTSGTAANIILVTSPFNTYPASSGQVWSAGAYHRLDAGTARSFRTDIRFYDASLVDIGGTNGSTTTSNSTWQRRIVENVTAPANTAWVAIRVVYLAAAIGDSVFVDGMQLEQGSTLPAYNEPQTILGVGVADFGGTYTAAGTAQSGTLPVPQNLVADAVSPTQINLTWDNVVEATAYDIERDSVIIVFDHPTNSYSDTGLTQDTSYSYRVRSVG